MYSESLILIGAIVALAVMINLTLVTLHVYGLYRDRKELKCPETGRLTPVQIGAGKAAISSLFGEPKIRVKGCANWPEKKNCAQKCLEIQPFPYSPAV